VAVLNEILGLLHNKRKAAVHLEEEEVEEEEEETKTYATQSLCASSPLCDIQLVWQYMCVALTVKHNYFIG